MHWQVQHWGREIWETRSLWRSLRKFILTSVSPLRTMGFSTRVHELRWFRAGFGQKLQLYGRPGCQGKKSQWQLGCWGSFSCALSNPIMFHRCLDKMHQQNLMKRHRERHKKHNKQQHDKQRKKYKTQIFRISCELIRSHEQLPNRYHAQDGLIASPHKPTLLYLDLAKRALCNEMSSLLAEQKGHAFLWKQLLERFAEGFNCFNRFNAFPSNFYFVDSMTPWKL